MKDVPLGLPAIDFRIHRLRANEAGGRHEFEQMVTSLVDQLCGPAHGVRPNPGDWGIDVFTGDLSGRVRIWQVKYFIDGVGKHQLDAARGSFRRACQEAATQGFDIDGWALCVPVSLDGPTTQRFDRWREERTRATGIPIDLWDETRLRTLLMRADCAGIRRVYYGRSEEDPAPAVTTRLRVRPDEDVIDAGEPAAGRWHGGAELRITAGSYLLHDPVTEWTDPQRSWVLRACAARELEPGSRMARVRHLRVRRPTVDASQRLADLRTQAELLGRLGATPGLPALLAQDGGTEHATLVLSAPEGRPWREVHGRLAPGTTHGGTTHGEVDRIAAATVLADAAQLCRTVAHLHRRGLSHRWLTPDDVLIPRAGRAREVVALRDLGLAGMREIPGAGGPHLAPEQRHPNADSAGGASSAGGPSPVPRRTPGPATDVYQVAVLVLTAIGGRLPAASPPSLSPLPAPPRSPWGAGLPGSAGAAVGAVLPEDVDALLARAVAVGPGERPTIDELADGLRAGRRRLSVDGPRRRPESEPGERSP